MDIELDFDYRLRPEDFKIIYGLEAPEEISERLRREFGAALAEAEGIANAEATLIKLDFIHLRGITNRVS